MRSPEQDGQCLIGIDPSQLADQQEQRQHGDLIRDDERRQIHEKQEVPAKELKPRKRIRRQRGRGNLADRDDGCHKYAVEVELYERHGG
ncbi:MAG: hypothetical protein IPK52_16615 [Chloroflexi bacterium]|nr:hypothetical protein [Chloroflexota bacterium]